MANVSGSFEWDTVGIPLVKGVDLNTRARLVDPAALLVAENIAFPRNGGLEMRRGHIAKVVKSNAGELGAYVGDGTLPDNNLFGYGYADEDTRDDSDPGQYSAWPNAGSIHGLFTNDKEVVAWNGYRAYKNSERHTFATVDNAIFPSCHSETVAKTLVAQGYSDCGDNGVIRVVATMETDSAPQAYAYCYDSLSKSLLFKVELITPATDPEYIRVVPLTNCVQVFVNDATDNLLYCFVIFNGDYYTTFPTSQRYDLGDCSSSWDVRKVNNNLSLVARITAAATVELVHVGSTGSVSTYFNPGLVPDLGGGTALKVAIAQHPVTYDICLLWEANTSTVYARIYSQNGVALYSRATVSALGNTDHLTVVAGWNLNGTGVAPFHLFVDDVPAALINSRINYYILYSTLAFNKATRYNLKLASHAFRVGNLPFVMACHVAPSGAGTGVYDTQYLLLDDRLKPCGRVEYGTAIYNSVDWMPTVNCMDTSAVFDTLEFHTTLMYKVRLANDDAFVYQEPSTRYLQLNFLPKFQSVSAGKSTYIPGMQLWQYDGNQFVEAGFHIAPVIKQFSVGGGGSLTTDGVYTYRVYIAHKNAKGEEVRSNAFFSEAVVLFGANTLVELEINTLPTCRDDAYFLVYRNESAQTLWYLVSSRDPSSADCVKNTLSASSVTFTDTLSDADLISRELDPANSSTYLESYSPPASEIISYGKDRIWLAGGEIPPGIVYGSRLFNDRTSATFHPALYIEADKSTEAVTAINFNADYMSIFKKTSSYIVSGSLPDNEGLNGATYVQMSLTDTGVTSVAYRHTFGIFFQSLGGIRMVNASGGVEYVGNKVEPATTIVNSILSIPEDRQLRFYQDDSCLVLDYESGEWSTWTCGGKYAIINPSTSLAIVAVGDSLWFEREGVYTDGDVPYGYRIKSAFISKQLGNFQRIRRVGAVGEYQGLDVVDVSVYFDEAAAPFETVRWDAAADLTTALWGSNLWGTGFWGDAVANEGGVSRDSIWRFVWRPGRQKCSAVSVEIIYRGSTKGPVVTGLLFEIGVKPGMQKLQTTFTNVMTPNRGSAAGSGGGGG